MFDKQVKILCGVFFIILPNKYAQISEGFK